MRRFEYVGGTSKKFWEVERDGTEVTVRFGRLDTNGQTQTKDLGTEGAATAHVERLVAEKVKKGYLEGVASAAGPASAPAPVAPASPAAEVAAVSDSSAARAPAPKVESRPPPDETRFSVPPAWARQAERFRGRRPAAGVQAVPSPPELAAALEQPVTAVLGHPSSDSTLVERAERHAGRPSGLLRRADQGDALGAAVLLAIACSALGGRGRTYLPRLADDLVLGYGLPFAAEVGALLTTVDVTSGQRYGAYRPGVPAWLMRAGPDELVMWARDGVLARLRTHLAGTDDDAYSEAVARLAAVRAGAGIAARVLTSYLAPTEQDWVDEDAAAYGRLQAGREWPLLLASVTTPAQAEAVLAASSAWAVINRSELVYSLAANLGTGAVDPLSRLLDQAQDADATKRLLGMVAAIPTDVALDALLDRIDRKYVTPVVIEAMAQFPARSLRLLAARSSGSSAAARTCRELLRGHLISNPGLADRLGDELDANARSALEAIAESTAAVPVADQSRLPPVLVSPPWHSRAKRAKPPVVTGLESRAGLVLRWLPGEQETHAALKVHTWAAAGRIDMNKALAAVLGPTGGNRWGALQLVANAPPDLVRPYLATFTPDYLYNALEPLQRILARIGDTDAAAFVVRIASSKPTSLARALLPVEGPEVAERMAEWLVRAKSVRPVARAWLERHAAAAARDLVPGALSKPSRERTAAEAALRAIDQAGHGQEIRAAAAAYGEEALAGIDALLAADPLDQLPNRMPAPPAWLDPAHLAQVLLPGREAALPVEAVGHICTMLALSKPGETYAGIAIVREATDPASLAEMAWGLFERWQGAGFPAKEAWVLEALGLLGNDETVRRLAPLIRAWPGEGAHARAVAALDVLSAIGTDVALMHLHGIAEKAKFKALKTKAKEKMADVADGLGLTAEQLADRLVPDFGLDRDGTMVLDYGPRRFTVGFDEQLRPFVADEDGSRRKVLPKPGASDDPALSRPAYVAFSGLKKDVKTIAADQIRRLERAMVQSRRWRAEEQRTLFVEHPLLWHLARRLVWATFDADGRPTGSFRVAEDRTLADANDEELTLTADVSVGVAHPLHLGDAVGTWSDLFADYEILQPFPQLGRDTWQLTDDERHGRVLRRLAGVTVATGRVLGLSHRGWERGPVMDGGIAGLIQKTLPDGNVLVIDLDPGLMAGAAMEWKEQKLTAVWISRTQVEWGRPDGDQPFSALDDVTASELVRDLEHLRG